MEYAELTKPESSCNTIDNLQVLPLPTDSSIQVIKTDSTTSPIQILTITTPNTIPNYPSPENQTSQPTPPNYPNNSNTQSAPSNYSNNPDSQTSQLTPSHYPNNADSHLIPSNHPNAACQTSQPILSKYQQIPLCPTLQFIPATSPPLPVRLQPFKARVPRPANAFMLYANENRQCLAKQHPLDSNKEISKRLGQCWKQLGLERKGQYYAMAKQVDKEHKRKYPDYVYNPKEARIRKAMRDATREKIMGAGVAPTSRSGRRAQPWMLPEHDEQLMMSPGDPGASSSAGGALRAGMASPMCGTGFPMGAGIGPASYMHPSQHAMHATGGYSMPQHHPQSAAAAAAAAAKQMPLHPHHGIMSPGYMTSPLAQLQHQTDMWHPYHQSQMRTPDSYMMSPHHLSTPHHSPYPHPMPSSTPHPPPTTQDLTAELMCHNNAASSPTSNTHQQLNSPLTQLNSPPIHPRHHQSNATGEITPDQKPIPSGMDLNSPRPIKAKLEAPDPDLNDSSTNSPSGCNDSLPTNGHVLGVGEGEAGELFEGEGGKLEGVNGAATQAQQQTDFLPMYQENIVLQNPFETNNSNGCRMEGQESSGCGNVMQQQQPQHRKKSNRHHHSSNINHHHHHHPLSIYQQPPKKPPVKPLPDFNEAFGSTERGRFQSPPDPRRINGKNNGYLDFFLHNNCNEIKFEDYHI